METISPVSWQRKLLDILRPLEPLIEERRRHRRRQACAAATLGWTKPSAGAMPVVITDVSISGIRVEMPSPVFVPQIVRVTGEDREHAGILIYCEKSGPRFAAGIELLNLDDPTHRALIDAQARPTNRRRGSRHFPANSSG